jgi:hypothetical protein
MKQLIRIETARQSSIVFTAAHASSPATSAALLEQLSVTQPYITEHLTRGIPDMLPKAYRWIAEMEEISKFVDTGLASTRDGNSSRSEPQRTNTGGPIGEGHVHYGFARLYENVARSFQRSSLTGDDTGEVQVLRDFVERAKVVKSRK